MTPKAGSFILMLAVQSNYSEAILASSHIAPVFLVGYQTTWCSRCSLSRKTTIYEFEHDARDAALLFTDECDHVLQLWLIISIIELKRLRNWTTKIHTTVAAMQPVTKMPFDWSASVNKRAQSPRGTINCSWMLIRMYCSIRLLNVVVSNGSCYAQSHGFQVPVANLNPSIQWFFWAFWRRRSSSKAVIQ